MGVMRVMVVMVVLGGKGRAGKHHREQGDGKKLLHG